jgi:hypothetical protein
MDELPPIDLLKNQSADPRPRSNWANIISGSIALLALVCSIAALSVTAENQCSDRRDRRILQQPNVWLDRVRDEGAIYLVNSGPGAALIKEYSQSYKGHPALRETVGGNYQDLLNSQMFGAEGEWAFGMSSLFLLREAASLCAGAKVDGCLRIHFDLNYKMAGYMMSPGERIPVIRIVNIDEVKKRVTDGVFLDWQNAFGAALIPDDVDFRIEYCPLSAEFGPCRTMTHTVLSPFPDLPPCPSGIAGLLRSWITWWR